MALMTLSVRLDPEQVKYLKKMSHYLSIERDADLSYNDLIREAIEAQYPMPVESDHGNENNSAQRL